MSAAAAAPGWVMLLVGVACASVFMLRIMSLMASRQQKIRSLWVLALAVAYLTVFAVLRRNSFNHAMLLLIDVTLSFTVALHLFRNDIARLYFAQSEGKSASLQVLR